MRNPNRTTKPERRAIRRYNPYAARVLGVAQAARWYREGILLDEVEGFDNILNSVLYGPVPLDLNELVNAALDDPRDRLERILGTAPGMFTPTSSNVNHYGTHTGYEVSDGPNPHITLKYAPHVSLGADGAPAAAAAIDGRLTEYIAPVGGIEPEPLGPSECGHYEVVEMTASADYFAVPYPSEPRPQVVPESWVTVGDADGGAWFAKYQAYREGREAGDAYLVWDGDPWHDPNEAADVHAQATENALNDDIDPGE